MNGAMQDDELWRRAFSANAGLFFDAPASDGLGLLSVDGAGLADRAPSPAPTTHNDSNIAPIAPLPAMELSAPVTPHQQHQQHQPQQPTLRVQVRGRLADQPPPQSRPALLQQQQQRIMAAPAVSVPALGAATAPITLPAAGPVTNESSSDQVNLFLMCRRGTSPSQHKNSGAFPPREVIRTQNTMFLPVERQAVCLVYTEAR